MREISVSFDNKGEMISGVLHLPERVPAPAVIYCHGFTGHRVESHRLFVHAARFMSKRGIAALRFDFRGSGESEGEFESMTVSEEISDLIQALNFISNREEIIRDKIGTVGLSLGGAVSILAAAKDERIRAICTWSAPADFKSLQQSVERIFGRPVGIKDLITQEYIDLPSGYRIGRKFLLDIMTHDILASCAKISPRPLLIVHGTLDQLVPVENAEMLYQKAGEPKKKFLIEGADHTFARADWEREVIENTTKWLEKNLGGFE